MALIQFISRQLKIATPPSPDRPLANVNGETLRYYERHGFPEKPPRSASGYRLYSSDAVCRIRFIKRAQALGFSLREIKELLTLSVGRNLKKCAAVRKRVQLRYRQYKRDERGKVVRTNLTGREWIDTLGFLAKLTRHIPKPYMHHCRYSGAYSSRFRGRVPVCLCRKPACAGDPHADRHGRQASHRQACLRRGRGRQAHDRCFAKQGRRGEKPDCVSEFMALPDPARLLAGPLGMSAVRVREETVAVV